MGPQGSVLCFPQVLACIPGEYGGVPCNPMKEPFLLSSTYGTLTYTQVIGDWSYTPASVNRDLGAIFLSGVGLPQHPAYWMS